MIDVKCYLCGRNYLPTVEATTTHTHHAQGGDLGRSEYGNRVESITRDLEACQAERDTALRLSHGHRIIDLDYLEEIADIMATRMQLAVVQQVPQTLLDMMVAPSWETWQPFRMGHPVDIGILRMDRQGNVLTMRIEVNFNTVATFRFEGKP